METLLVESHRRQEYEPEDIFCSSSNCTGHVIHVINTEKPVYMVLPRNQ